MSVLWPAVLLATSGPGSGKLPPDGPAKARCGDEVIDVIEEDNDVAYVLWAMENDSEDEL